MERPSDALTELITMSIASDDWEIRRAAIYVFNEYEHIPEGWLIRVRKDADARVRYAAVETFKHRRVPIEWIKDALEDDIPNIRILAIECMKDRTVPYSWIEQALNDGCWLVNEAAKHTFLAE